jgi:hypothetical protein
VPEIPNFPTSFLDHNAHLQQRLSTLRSDSVYHSKEQALDDLARLLKLGDADGIKLRVMQIYREREDLERVCEEIEYKVVAALKDGIEARDKAIGEMHIAAMAC